MKITDIFKGMVLACAVVMMAASCSKEEDKPVKELDLSLTASVASQGFDGVVINFTAGADVASVQYACGSQLKAAADELNFSSGAGIKIFTAQPSDGSFTVKPDAASPATIFLRTIGPDGEKGDVIALNAVASPISYSVSKASLGSFVYTVGETGDYEGISFLAMAADAPADWGMSAEEIIDMFAMFGELLPAGSGESGMVELNGDPDYPMIIGVVYWDANYDYTIKTFDYTTGPVLPDVAEATIDAKVENITAESADLVITPGEATCGYFYGLYTKEDYDEFYNSEAASKMADPLDYICSICAAGGSMDYKATKDSRVGLSAGTDYVLACFPYNANGNNGWGKAKIVSFKTLD